MTRIFTNIYRFFESHKILMWLCLVIVTVLAAASALRLNFVEDIGRFFPDGGDNARINYAYQHLGSDNRIVINVGCPGDFDYESVTDAVEDIAWRLSEQDTTGLVKEIIYSIDDSEISEVAEFITSNLPYYLTAADYVRIDTLLSKQNIERQLLTDKAILSSPVGFIQGVILSDPLFFSSRILEKLNGFRASDQYESREGYIFEKDTDEAVIIVSSAYPVSETANNGRLIKIIEDCCTSAESEYGVTAKPFGVSMVSLTNSSQIKRDSLWAICLSLILIFALLLYYYRNFRSIVLIAISILFGGLIALGIIALVKNPVSVIAIGVASVIIGIAVNYPIHVLSHFRRTGSREEIIRDVVSPLLTGNITTIGAFLSLLFISSDAMRDLGLFAALLLLGTILFVIIFLPHLLGKYRHFENELAFRKLAEYHPEGSKWVMLAVVLLTCVFLVAPKASFDTDMHHINYMTEDQAKAFARIAEKSDTSTRVLYCVAQSDVADHALKLNGLVQEKIKDMAGSGFIAKVSGIGSFIPDKDTQTEAVKRWNNFWETRRETFLKTFDIAARAEGFKASAFDAFRNTINRRDWPCHDMEYFETELHDLAGSYISQADSKTLIYNILEVKNESFADVEAALNAINPDVYAFADSSIAARMAEALSGDFDKVLYICGFIVFAFLLFSFGRIEIVLLAFLPLVIAWVWILGIMGLTGMQFNIVNIILATFIFGMGDDYSIFVTEGAMYEYRTGRQMLSQFKNSIILSALIMFIGIGMLIFAKHPAMRSLAEVTVIGMASVVTMAYIIPPFLFNLLTKKHGRFRLMPVTLWNFLKTVISFAGFLLCAIFITFAGFFILTIGGKTPRHKAAFHKLLCKIFRMDARLLPGVKFTVKNESGETFDKPAVITCNHQSHLDLLYTLMLSPKVVAMTNEWVWKSPFYGWILRYADFLPIAEGFEENIPKLAALVEQGYSILVFPEGTRSETCSILRFHQGAFFLAERLGLDVVPVMLHGTGHVLPKREFMLRRGHITVEIGRRIAPDDAHRKGSTLETAKAMRKFYQSEYARLSAETENFGYYIDLVRKNYIYKGRETAALCRRELKKAPRLEESLVGQPSRTKVLLKNCGCGSLSLLSALGCKDLEFVATESDPIQMEIAKNTFTPHPNLLYRESVEEGGFDLIIDLAAL